MAIHGYGFALYEDDVRPETFMSFILNHSKSFTASEQEFQIINQFACLKKKAEKGKNVAGDLEELIDEITLTYWGEESGFSSGIKLIIATIMKRETALEFIPVENYMDMYSFITYPAVIIHPSTLPWLMTPKEQKLKEQDLYNICKRYMEELDVKGTPMVFQ